MKSLIILFAVIFTLVSCEERFEKEKYDVLFTIRNSTDQAVILNVDEIDGRIDWKKSLTPSEVFEIRFNVKKDIDASEGGFIFKATFPDGETIEKNAGYYTNYQMGWKNPQHYVITKDSISMSNAE